LLVEQAKDATEEAEVATEELAARKPARKPKQPA
jgi:hypothetical protein